MFYALYINEFQTKFKISYSFISQDKPGRSATVVINKKDKQSTLEAKLLVQNIKGNNY